MQNTTLLLDLDDTLLDTNIDAFAPIYFSALSSALAEKVTPENMLPALIGGTRAMAENEDPQKRLVDVFDAFFYPHVGIEKEDLKSRIDIFYRDIFPTLSFVSKKRPEAIEFVNWAFNAGFRIVIATNPYFPLVAVHHRMRWAGLSPEDYSFALVSSYETFHFTKDHPAYFLETLAQLGWPDGPVVMVGNDLDMDLLPAHKAGLPIFWLREGFDETQNWIPQGNFRKLRSWLENTDPTTRLPVFTTIDSLLGILRSTPGALSMLIQKIPSCKWKIRNDDSGWGATPIFCHLRDVENEIFHLEIQRLLLGKSSTRSASFSEECEFNRSYEDEDGRSALAGYFSARRESLARINEVLNIISQPLQHENFDTSSFLGVSKFMAGHDRKHVQQIWKLIQ